MYKSAIVGYIIFFIFYIGKTTAQDSHLSQFDAAPLYLNPALTGMYSGDYRAYLNYRSQWASVASKPFVTSAVSYDMPKHRFGVGGYIMNNMAGIGGFNVLNFVLSGAYEITTDPKLYNHLSVGLQLGFIHKNFKPDNYLWDNQYDNTYNGGGFNPEWGTGETFNKTSIFMPESNMGVYYYNTNDQIAFNPFGGFSLYHILSPKETFSGTLEQEDPNRLPRKWVFHGGCDVHASDAITIEPVGLFMKQTNNNELYFGILGYYNLSAEKANQQDSETILFLGPYYRNKDAMVIHLGFVYKNFTYRLSYDVNTSSLNKISNYKGGFEISVIYKKPKTQRVASIETY